MIVDGDKQSEDSVKREYNQPEENGQASLSAL
jgi:hypothetical protein